MIYRCPFNYIGSKSQLLNVLIPIINQHSNYALLDLFAGGFSVGVNVSNIEVIYNDINNDMKNLIELLYNETFITFNKKMEKLINEYKLSKTNKEGYLRLRKDFNTTKDTYLFALLIFYSFNHQIRYNQSLEFNTPFGTNRSSYNENTRKKLKVFFELLHKKKITFLSNSFEKIRINKKMIVYADPPYLLTTGSYNDGNREVSSWNISREKELYRFLDSLNEQNIPFVLSNMLSKGDKINPYLNEWSKSYNVINVETNYKNYRRKKEKEIEIIVTNFGK